MEPGFEAAKGAAEKVLGVKLPVFMRLVLPGLLATAVLYPVVAWLLSFLPSSTDLLWERIAAYAVLVFLLGGLISTGTSEIYKVYEGRAFWPDGLFEWARKRQQARVERIMRDANDAQKAGKNARYDELWYRLRDYRIDPETGDPVAEYPTMLGNILASYEQYPATRYGMDSVFFWQRIWLQIDKEQKEEIDGQWCVADGFLTLSAISVGGAAVWSAQAAAAMFHLGQSRLPFATPGRAMLGAAGWVLLAWLWYRVSLPFHRENGEVFKAIFDIYRDKVWTLTSLKPDEKEAWDATWAYLQYLMIKCPGCAEYTSVLKPKCTACGAPLP